MSKILNNIIFKRILVIFVVGLVSRSVVNIVFDVNVFKDFMGVISLGYYGLMACFSAYVSELTHINLSSLNLNVFRSAAKAVSEKISGQARYSFNESGGSGNAGKIGDSLKRGLTLNQNSPGERGVNRSKSISSSRPSSSSKSSAGVTSLYGNSIRPRKPSAGVLGLYGNDSSNGLSSRSTNYHSSGSRNRRDYVGDTIHSTDIRNRNIKVITNVSGDRVNNSSLNRHNQYHVDTGNIPKNSLIGRSIFSYQNIHLNIGNVRWYSSKTYLS
jgi:hypothetical protein